MSSNEGITTSVIGRWHCIPRRGGRRPSAQGAWLFLALLALLGSLFLPIAARALSDPSEMLPNPAQEKRAEEIGDQLRCLVCQNESVEGSTAELARDLRHIIRRQVTEGRSDQQIIAWMVARYGNFVLLKPPFDDTTLLLWGAPVLALGVGTTAIMIARRRPSPGPAPLSDEEQRRASELLTQ